jgi:hypothetical protein
MSTTGYLVNSLRFKTKIQRRISGTKMSALGCAHGHTFSANPPS